jgi:hypothetical protein
MARRELYTAILTALVALCAAAAVSARPSVGGGLGVELDGYVFSRTALASGLKMDDVSRSLSSPYLDLRLKSPLWDERVAHLSVAGRLSGAYYRSVNQGEGTSGRSDPALTRYDVRLSLFGMRPFPLGFYMNKAEIPSLRYEVNQRAVSGLENPTLAVIRRYDTVAEQRGAIWKFALPRRTTLSFTAQQNKNTSNRQYDFGEDKDIFVDFALIRPDDVASVHPVTVRNEIEDDTVLLFIDQAFVDTLDAGESVLLTLEAGVHDTEFVPLALNPFRSTVNVRGVMQWRIVHNPPPGSKDVARSSDIVRSTFSAGGDGPFKNETFLVYDRNREDVQRMNTWVTNFNNMASYDRSPATRFDFLTTLTKNKTVVEDVSSQTGLSLMHMTTARYRRRRGASLQASHSFGRASTTTDVSDIATTTNTVLGSGSLPTGFKRHVIATRVSASYLSDNQGYRSEQYQGELDNQLELRAIGVRWRPRYIVKYTAGARKNPDGSTSELESHAILSGEVLNLGVIGQATVKGEHSWRRRETNANTGTKDTFLAEFGVRSRTMKGANLGFNTSHELQTFGRVAVIEEGDDGISANPLEDQVRHTYRIDLQSSVSSDFTAGMNAMYLTTNDTRVFRFMGSLFVRLPGLRLPVRSSLMSESRSLVGLPTQKVFEVQTRASLGIRRVRFVLMHTYSRDRQRTEEFVYQQLLATLTRDFEVW